MHEWQSLSHVRWDCKYHVVIIPKYRRKVFYGRLRRQIGVIVARLERQVAELLREQLLGLTRDELPHSIAVTTEEAEERVTASGEPLLALRVIVRVERDSQKAIVIGKGGSVLKAAGSAARRELEALLGTRVHLETRVKVDPEWQRRAGAPSRCR